MTEVLNRTADLIYSLMTMTSAKQVGYTSVRIMDAIQGEDVQNQILGLAATLVILLNHYDLSHTDALGIADNIVYSDENNNMNLEFKAIKKYMKSEWELLNNM